MRSSPQTKRSSLRSGALLVALSLALVGYTYVKLVHEHVVPKRFGVVEAGSVYRSGKLTPAALRQVARETGIRTIVDLGAYEPGTADEVRTQKVADALGVERYRMSLYGDATGNPNYYVQALRIITDPAKQPVLVNCGAGSQRTGCAVVLFRTLIQEGDLEAALAEARRFDYNPKRDKPFMEVYNTWHGPIAEALRRGGLIPGVDPVPEAIPLGRFAPAQAR